MANFSEYQSAAHTVAPTRPTTPSTGYPSGGDPTIPREATKPGPYHFYQLQEEFRNVLASAGITPNSADLTQLRQAILYHVGFPAGTIMFFQGTDVPAGWTRVTTNHDAALRLVGTGPGGTTGGGNGFEEALVGTNLSGQTILTESQIPAHRHLVFSDEYSRNRAQLASAERPAARAFSSGAGHGENYEIAQALQDSSEATLGPTSQTGGSAAHTHSIIHNTKYVNIIAGEKN